MDGLFIVTLIWEYSFDLGHFGHGNALRQAKSFGDVLVVGIHSDGVFKFLYIFWLFSWNKQA